MVSFEQFKDYINNSYVNLFDMHDFTRLDFAILIQGNEDKSVEQLAELFEIEVYGGTYDQLCKQ